MISTFSRILASVALLLTFAVTLPAAVVSASEGPPPVVGAIRWDGWYGGGEVVKYTEIALGQPKYHFRLPWFARITGESKVHIDGDSQEIMDQEIACAAEAGLNYWA